MPTYNEPKHIGDLLLVEVKPGWTKDTVVFEKDEGDAYELGTVLSIDDGKYVRYAIDDPQLPAVAVAAEHVNAMDADMPGVVIARGAVLAADEMILPAGLTEPQIAAVIADLDGRGIVVRTQL